MCKDNIQDIPSIEKLTKVKKIPFAYICLLYYLFPQESHHPSIPNSNICFN